MAASEEYQALFDHMHGAFEAALVSCMDYFRKVWNDKDQEITRLKAELEAAQLRSIEARNPGIDMDEVRRSRAGDVGVERASEV